MKKKLDTESEDKFPSMNNVDLVNKKKKYEVLDTHYNQ